MRPFLKGIVAGLILFAMHQAWHIYAHEPISSVRLMVDLAQWIFAGFCVGILFRAMALRAISRDTSQ